MNTIQARYLQTSHRSQGEAMARWWLGMILLGGVALFACWLVGTRPLDIGSDTETYAGFFENLVQGMPETRLEPGFVYLSYALYKLGLGVTGYQFTLFGLLLVMVALAVRRYRFYLETPVSWQTLLCASLMLLFISPMFTNASINAIRQGLAAPLVFVALLGFHRRRWGTFALAGALAASLHLSSAMYLACAPALLLSTRWLRVVAAGAFLAYVSGLSMLAVRAGAPGFYDVVMEYTANPLYRSGVRIDFAVFTIFWYLLPHFLAPLVQAQWRQRILDSTSVYLVMSLPFFLIGWGFFSNRYLLPAWLAVSMILAAVLCHARFAPLRNPLLIRVGLLASCGVFYIYVSRGIVI
ncbi:EpsG family protein [Pseudoxanthomonas sp. z9]|uniref:EpsG family protein n=1 Tax=Pseudoxanthomonas sp. z9 TaxID=2584942 RepID=UPI00114477A7|nr:EpsG family protein [Pseudoxanthomonas sp. z9]